ncbi:MAG TPA: MGMT family protein [Candidatus Aenigmarchaeota archaeon]|nr:MGMT family protein [Candidatus Aenigmarchaeota archaeon]
MTFSEMVYEVVKRIPRGRVSTYSEVARALNKPNAYRAVAQALKRNKRRDVPCHRVVMSSGHIGGFRGSEKSSIEEKKAILRSEGIEINGDRIDIERYLYRLSGS